MGDKNKTTWPITVNSVERKKVPPILEISRKRGTRGMHNIIVQHAREKLKLQYDYIGRKSDWFGR